MKIRYVWKNYLILKFLNSIKNGDEMTNNLSHMDQLFRKAIHSMDEMIKLEEQKIRLLKQYRIGLIQMAEKKLSVAESNQLRKDLDH